MKSEPARQLLACLRAERPLVIGHRGFCSIAPENTLPSFELAISAGADLVELDYRHTADGVPVVIHDAELDRTTDARRRWKERHVKVTSKTVTQIKSLDAGSWFDAKFAGAKIPTLAEALETIQKGSVALIERKDGDPASCLRVLREMRLINRVMVQSFDWEFLRALHEQEPELALGALGPPTTLADGRKPAGILKKLNGSWLDELQKIGASIAVWDRRVSKDAVSLARERGLRVWVYTINDVKLARRLVKMGVTGLITNNPGIIIRSL